MDIELNPIKRRLMMDRFDFYYMSLALSPYPQRRATFKTVECRLDFGPEGKDMPIVETIFPEAQWRTVLEWGGGMKLAVDGNL